jgi:hypothetical protein
METLLDSLNLAWSNISFLVINLIAALFLLLVGLLIAKGLGQLTNFLLKSLQLNKLSKQVGFDQILEKGNIKKSASELAGDLVYWVIALVVILGVLGAFGLPIEPAMSRVFAYMSTIFLAALILAIGVFLAGFIAAITRTIMANAGFEGAKIVSRIIYYIVIIFAFLTALSELGVSLDVFIPHIGVIVGAFGLAAAIAFGLGCKDMAADFLHNLIRGK